MTSQRTTPRTPDGVPDLQEELAGLLQEDDPRRRLDSLETVVVLSYFARQAPGRTLPELPDAPRTIEGWVTWADQRSSAS
ncbi:MULTISPECIES: hypothetical protein [Streptomyces]|uniref:NosJ n=2 Tax=Streptomyces TaxID=1883 RepID=C6FX49_STRAS|nr:hypothetical protein [Streptomyces actuosus]ACR48339.1 NosJ [Streptomyces actuosus]AWT44905.1 hypothetical protein DMT42_23180 [Streptomyces actuosus]MBM4821460.1 hypothetical protein [Streptomyces actuosus]